MTNAMPVENEEFNVTLLVSNQSLDLSPVDIEISVDDRPVLRDEFDVGPPEMPQHNWKEVHLRLARGTHSILAQSKKGNARLYKSFDVSDVRSITVAFWHGQRTATGRSSSGTFTIEFSSGQTATM